MDHGEKYWLKQSYEFQRDAIHFELYSLTELCEKNPHTVKLLMNRVIKYTGFSINDPDSILKVYDLVEEKYSINKRDISILLNERGDRFFRTNQHIDMLDNIEYKNVYICGDNLDYIEKRLKAKNINCKKIKSVEDIKDEDIIFGCGNIKGLGFKIIEYYKKGEE